MGYRGLGVANPELDGIGDDVGEGEMLAVGGPVRFPGHAPAGSATCVCCAVGDAHQVEGSGAGSDAVAARRVVLAVVLRLDAHARETQEGRRDARDRRVLLPGDQQNACRWSG